MISSAVSLVFEMTSSLLDFLFIPHRSAFKLNQKGFGKRNRFVVLLIELDHKTRLIYIGGHFNTFVGCIFINHTSRIRLNDRCLEKQATI